MVTACLIGAIALGCGSKDTSTGVARLDDNNQVVTADNSSQNILQSEGSVEPLSDSSSSAENTSEQTDEEVATSFAECFDLYFTSTKNARIHAKLLHPKKRTTPTPAVIHRSGCGRGQ